MKRPVRKKEEIPKSFQLNSPLSTLYTMFLIFIHEITMSNK